MNNADLLELLQDIWEGDGMFSYLTAHYVRQRNYNIIEIQKIIKFGIVHDIFNIYKCKNHSKLLTLDDFKLVQKCDAMHIVNNQEEWKQNEIIYEVTFIDNEKWFRELFNLKIIPKVFLNSK